MTDAEILSTARFVSPAMAARYESEFVMMNYALGASRKAGRCAHLITWPNGIVFMIEGEPSNTNKWATQVIESYRAAEAGTQGSISKMVAL